MNTGNGKLVLLRVIVMGGLASLAGCGKDGNGNGDSSGFSNPGSVMTIQNYSIVGNRPLLTGSSVPQIDSAASTSFFVEWTITGNNVYTAQAFVSADNVLDTTDREILTGCNKTSSSTLCLTTPVTYSCSFSSPRSLPPSTNLTVACNDPVTGTLFATGNLSLLAPSWALGSPAYIILQACNQPSGPCPASSPVSVKEVHFY